MRVLVTGATGFIGGALVERLADEGVSVRAGHRATSDVRPLDTLGVERAIADLDDPRTLRKAVRGCTHVVHLAAVRTRNGFSPAEVARTNVAGTEALARASAAEGVERFVFGSTIGVYGFVTRSPVDEATPLRPNSPYRRSKAEAERALRAVEAETGLPVAIGRICSTVGPGAWGWRPLVRSVRDGSFRLIGDGSNRIHTAHVSEMADALWRCAVRPQAAGETVVLGGAAPVSVRAFTGAVADALGVPRPAPGPPAAPYVAACHAASWAFRRTGAFSRWLYAREMLVADKWADTAKARTRLGVAPTWAAEDAVSDMVGAFVAADALR
ncbi:NAD-dependent epimerase/dehydratase family protein [Rubrivirga sp.]|uniref:NAD-dependent epimerase/dehydratase family protein n=1 Tax=Rubrivirga sp. TaxID=1885344 RepID=UPI003B52CF7B